MTVNVYTYYQNKLALQAYERRIRRAAPRGRVRRRLGPLTRWGALLGSLLGLFVAVVTPVSNPPTATLAGVGLLWGAGLGMLADRLLGCARKMVAALRGKPLSLEDVRALR